MRIDLYLRKSSDDSGKSVGQQEEELTEGIESAGHEVGRRFSDRAHSASRHARKDRPDYAEMITYAESGECEALGIWDVNRGGRKESTYFALLDLCRERGIRLWVATHGRLLDLRRPADWRIVAQEILEAAAYSDKLSIAVKRGKRGAAKEGKPDGGPALYGYRKTRDDKGRVKDYEIDEPKAAVVRCMAAGALAGTSNAWIARWLNAFEVPSPAGRAWTPRNVARLLGNPAYMGKRVHRPVAQDEDGHEYDAKWPPIIPAEQFRRLVARTEAAAQHPRRGAEPRWLLGGVGECGRDGCAGTMRALPVSGRMRYSCRLCHGVVVPAAVTDEWVEAVALEYLRDERAAHLFVGSGNDDTVTARTRLEVQALTDRLAGFRVKAIAGTVSPESFAEIEAALLPQLKAAGRRLSELTTPPALAHLAGVDIPAKWESFDVGTKREIIRRIMRVTVLPAAHRGERWSPARLWIERRGA